MIKKNFRIMAGGYKMVTFHTIEGALEDLKRGKIILVTDDENRENEGDFICAAQFATTENINFMATHGKGLVPLYANVGGVCRKIKTSANGGK